MIGYILYMDEGVMPGMHKRGYCGILVSDVDTSFKHNYIIWPSPKNQAYGDKEVIHRKMVGSAKPSFSGTDVPWDGSDHGEIGSPWEGQTLDWHMGTSESSYHFRYDTFDQTGDCFYEELTRIGNEIHMRRKWNEYDDWYDYGAIAHYDPQESGEEHGWVTWLPYWKVEFEISNPVPYYWLQFMEDKRPEYNPTALSELIRNVITDNTTWNTNNYANALEIIDLVNDFRKGKIGDLIENTKGYFSLVKRTVGNISGKNLRTLAKHTSKGIADGWLKYRYMYNTTKSDIESFVEAKVGEYFGELTPERVLRGSIDIDAGKLRVKMRLHDKSGPNFQKLLISANQYGLMPGLYNIWDMIPFSFVVDWFTGFGDILQDIDQSIYFDYYEIDELLVSVRQQAFFDGAGWSADLKWYDRYLLDEFPQWEIYQDDSKTSSRTKAYRMTDAGALIIGAI